MLVDFFRFPIQSANENELFNLEAVNLRSELGNLDCPSVTHSFVAIFDSDIIYRETQAQEVLEAGRTGRLSFAYLPNIKGNIGEEQIDAAVAMGCKAIVFHPYLQQVTGKDLPRIQALARYAADHNLFICVCAAYGSKDIFRCQPLESVIAAVEAVNCPVVIIHGGGAKVLDAFLIAESFPNIYLDTSFSLPYWIGSPIEEQFAFAIKQLGAERWMFGSDSPFWDQGNSIKIHYDFFERHKFSSRSTDCIMGGTASMLLGIK